jgi:hypothetical protein
MEDEDQRTMTQRQQGVKARQCDFVLDPVSDRVSIPHLLSLKEGIVLLFVMSGRQMTDDSGLSIINGSSSFLGVPGIANAFRANIQAILQSLSDGTMASPKDSVGLAKIASRT